MKNLKTFEQFVAEENALKAKDSKVYVDNITLDSGDTIKAAEILGAIASSETEKELETYFYQAYGQDAFRTEEMSKLKEYYNKIKEEENKEEVEKEEEEEGGEDDLGLGDL
jgi:hypothetical protein